WATTYGALSYDVQVAATSDFGKVLWKVNTVNTRAVPTGQVPSGSVWWRVRSVDRSGASSWSTASFTRTAVAGPALISPPNEASLEQPVEPALLTWNPVPGALEYVIEISTDSAFIDPALITTYKTKTPSYVVPSPQIARPYHWRVRAVLSAGIFTEWSAARSYLIEGLARPSEPVHPTNDVNQAISEVVLDWDPVPGATTYDIQISTDESFLTTDAASANAVKGTRYSPPKTLNNDQFYWRVRANDALGNKLDWGSTHTWAFRRHWPEQPQLTHPADQAVVGDPFFFQWTPVELASHYTVQISPNASFSPDASVTKCVTTHTTFIPQSTSGCWPGAAGTYYWRVLASDGLTNATGPRTDEIAAEVFRFTYEPDLVTLSSPPSGATVGIPTLRWQPVAGAAKYRVSITSVATGSTTTFVTATTSFTPRTALTVGASYRWQVQTLSEDGRLGTAILLGSQPVFTVGPAPLGTSLSPDPVAPSPGATFARFPTLSWEPVENATRYRILIRRAGTSAFTRLAPWFNYPAGEDETTNHLAPDDYEWMVEAYAGSTLLSPQAATSTFSISPPETVTGQGAALTGVATQAVTTSCGATLPNECQNLRQTPVLTWDPIPDAGYYRLYVSKDRELTNLYKDTKHTYPVTVRTNMWIPSESLPDSQAGSAYFWHVRPCRADGVCAPLDYADHAFNKRSNKVRALTPANGAEVADDVTLTWEDYLATNQDQSAVGNVDVTEVHAPVEARSYRVQVSTNPTFATDVLDNEVVDQTTFTSFKNTYPEGPVYWRVQAIDGTGNALNWSDVRTFTKLSPRPQLRSPSPSQSVSGGQAFSWDPLPFAASYDIEVFANNDQIGNTANRVVSGSSKQVAFSLPTPLPARDQRYTWRVRRVDASGRKGGWSDLTHPMSTFRVVGAAPALHAPSTGLRLPSRQSLFSWGPAPGASTYLFERRRAGSSTITESVKTAALAHAPTKAVADGTWQWRVTAQDAGGKALGHSPWRSFSVDATAPTVVYAKPGRYAKPKSRFLVTFNEPVVGLSGKRLVLRLGSRKVKARVVVNATRTAATLKPARKLKRGKRYTLTLLGGVADAAGNPVAPTTWSVTVREPHRMPWLDALGWGGSALLVYSLLQARVLRFRVLNLAACAVLVLFNGLLTIWPMVAMNLVLCAINVWFIVKLVRERHDVDVFEVLRVGPDDDYLRHMLRMHRADIERFQPGFVWEPSEDKLAYIVQRGDETVGVVLLRADGPDARVELDYVTPPYRDFTPGEFVWRRSGLLTDAGFRKVITPPDMVNAYYDRLGFRREGTSFVLDLPGASPAV
ncbi:DUF4962 domain-containing protein, partial [Nocardioides sp.]|uniref:Ig-like domain-containing protein n=1 Tax=Nocardioides sp. TaxID=35761 RepID=UPI0027353C71